MTLQEECMKKNLRQERKNQKGREVLNFISFAPPRFAPSRWRSSSIILLSAALKSLTFWYIFWYIFRYFEMDVAHDCPGFPAGWKREEVMRKSGLSSGKIDVYYIT